MMMLGEFIQDRWVVKLLRSIASERGLLFRSWSGDWIIEIGDGRNNCRVIGYRFPLNDSVAASIAQDKVATYGILSAYGVPAVPHELVRTKVSRVNRESMEKWERIVTKPLVGTSGHGVKMHDDVSEAISFIEQSSIQAWAVSPYVDIDTETRLIILDGKVLRAYEKRPVVIDGLKMFNLGLGATAVDVDPDDQLIDLAESAQSAMGLRLCAVDVVKLANGEVQVLEINDAIMMEHYARQSAENESRVKDVYRSILSTVFD